MPIDGCREKCGTEIRLKMREDGIGVPARCKAWFIHDILTIRDAGLLPFGMVIM
jgi:hypothetical protein